MNAYICKGLDVAAEPVAKSLGCDDACEPAHSLTDVKPFKDAHE